MKSASADFMMKRRQDIALFSSIILALVLWFVMFVVRPLNFWLMMSISTSLLAAVSFAFGGCLISREEITWKNIFLGVPAAAVLYGIFLIGNQALIFISAAVPALVPDRAGNIAAVYANMGTLYPFVVGALLFFPIGFGEEVFWRGFVQSRLSQRWGPLGAFALTTLLYAGAHLPTGNPVLILAALACGLFWGGLYMVSGRLVPVIVSHMVWDPLIFVIWPMK